MTWHWFRLQTGLFQNNRSVLTQHSLSQRTRRSSMSHRTAGQAGAGHSWAMSFHSETLSLFSPPLYLRLSRTFSCLLQQSLLIRSFCRLRVLNVLAWVSACVYSSGPFISPPEWRFVFFRGLPVGQICPQNVENESACLLFKQEWKS